MFVIIIIFIVIIILSSEAEMVLQLLFAQYIYYMISRKSLSDYTLQCSDAPKVIARLLLCAENSTM